LDVHFPAAILEILEEISEKNFQHFLAHIQEKSQKRLSQFQAVSEKQDKKCVWGVKYPPPPIATQGLKYNKQQLLLLLDKIYLA